MDANSSLGSKTVRGLVWSFAGLFTNQGIQFIVLVVLARVLTPEHFGLISMSIVFLTISNALIDGGFSQALIREKNPKEDVLSTVFFYNIGISLLLYGLIYSLAPFISLFFHQSDLTLILRIAALGIVINSLGIIQRVILQRNLHFKLQTVISASSYLIGGIVAIILALNDFGVWSLIVQSLVNQLLQLLFLWLFVRWKPMLIFRFSEFKILFHFGSKLLVSNIIDVVYNNLFSLIIGRYYSAPQLGYYTNAAKIGDVITSSTTGALQKVTYPVLSKLKDNEDKLRSHFRQMIRLSTYCIFPIMFGLMAIGDSLIPLLLGRQWMGSIRYFQLLCLSGMLYHLHALNLNILQVKGRSDLFLRLEIIKKTLLTLLIGVSLLFSFGVTGLILSGIISSYISLFINSYYSGKEVSYRTRHQLLDIVPTFLLAAGMGIIVFIIGLVLPTNEKLLIFTQIGSGIVLYVLGSKFFKIKEIDVFVHYVRKILMNNKVKLRINSKEV